MRTPTDLKSVGAKYVFPADEICNIVAIRFVVSPIRITPILGMAVLFAQGQKICKIRKPDPPFAHYIGKGAAAERSPAEWSQRPTYPSKDPTTELASEFHRGALHPLRSG